MRVLAGWIVTALLLATAGCASFSVNVEHREPVPAPKPKPETTRPAHGPKKTLGIPPGHFPPPGQCRVWRPGSPPGHQPKAGPCHVVERRVHRGEWLIYRPSQDRRIVMVYIYDGAPLARVATRVYDSGSGEYLRDQ